MRNKVEYQNKTMVKKQPKTHRYIEVWFNDLLSRNFIFVKDMIEARRQCKLLSLKGCTGICVDITFKDTYGDLIENKSKWYSFKDGKLKKI